MNTQQIRQKTEQYVLHTYNRFPVAFTRGKGMYLYDAEGNEYLDFAAGIAVHALGHAHPVFTKAIQEQAGLLIHTSNLYYHDRLAEASEKLAKAAGMDKVFFTNSGTEAIEGAPRAVYTSEQYQHHLEDLRRHAEVDPGYDPVFMTQCPFDNVRIYITETKVSVIRIDPSPITFETSHPQMHQAFLDYAVRLMSA